MMLHYDGDRKRTYKRRMITDPNDNYKILAAWPPILTTVGTFVEFKYITDEQLETMLTTYNVRQMSCPQKCAPRHNVNTLVLRNYTLLLQVRDDALRDYDGELCGDHCFMRCWYASQKYKSLWNRHHASTAAKNPKDEGPDGAGADTQTTGLMTRIKLFRGIPDAIHWAFRMINGRFWHRQLLPFGCFFYENVNALDQRAYEPWIKSLLPVKPLSNTYVNPYSVTHADVLYLVNTENYLERILNVVIVILELKQCKYNLLRFTPRHTENDHTTRESRTNMSLERYLHLFGCLYMHRCVMANNLANIGGNWTEKIRKVEYYENMCYQVFGLMSDQKKIQDFLQMFMVDKPKPNNNSVIQSVFPNAMRIGQ